jgi:POT family proton-dependent oligopeptide transporter
VQLSVATPSAAGARSKYPTGLFFLFFTEMWERFSFYGISAILVLYLTGGLGLSDRDAALTSGAYMAFTFMTPMLGGFVADRVLGLRYSVSLGGLLILIGNFVLARGQTISSVFAGLAVVALGTGFLKATVSVMVGKLYPEGDTRRDSGYTLFYMGINLGSLLAGLFIGEVARRYGWTRGFYLSTGGMALGLVVFQLGYRHYNDEADGFRRERLFARSLGVPNVVWIAAGTVGLGALMVYLFQRPDVTKKAVSYLAVVVLAGLFVLGARCEDRRERRSIYAILIIVLAAIAFQTFFKQMYNSLPLFVERDFDRVLFGVPLTASFFALVPNSVSVIVFAGVFTWLWARLAARGQNPSIAMKLVLALALAVTSSGLLAWVGRGIAASGQPASAWWVVLAIAILTLGELNILPMGLSAVSTLAPKRFASLLMGAWFLCNSLGGYFSGVLSSLADIQRDRVQDVSYSAAAYSGLYGRCAGALAVVTVVMFLGAPLVKRLMAAEDKTAPS